MCKLHVIVSLTLFAALSVGALAADHQQIKPPMSSSWMLDAMLSATDEPLQLGFSTSISGDTIVTNGAGGGTGVYVYTRTKEFWSSTTTPTAELTTTDAGFVYAVAISGNVIVAGAYGADGTGVAYVYVEPAGGWTNMAPTATLTASDAISGDLVGYTVAIAGNTIVVGAPENDEVGSRYPEPNGPGAVYVYVKPAGGWSDMTETAKLTASDGVVGDDLGWSVAVLGDIIVAGAPDATVNSQEIAGAVYVFQKGPFAPWKSTTQTAKLTASDAEEFGVVGISVSIAGNTIAAAGFSNLYAFTQDETWTNSTQTAELGDTSIYFGGFNSVAICENFIVGGSPYGNKPKADIYVISGSGWVNMSNPTNILPTPPNHGNGLFGWSAAVQGSTIVIGSETNGGSGGDILYVYTPSSS
jgi:hypothetical protein